MIYTACPHSICQSCKPYMHTHVKRKIPTTLKKTIVVAKNNDSQDNNRSCRVLMIRSNRVYKKIASIIMTLQICRFFSTIQQTLCEVSADCSRDVCGRFPDDGILPHTNLQINYVHSSFAIKLLVTCTVPLEYYTHIRK